MLNDYAIPSLREGRGLRCLFFLSLLSVHLGVFSAEAQIVTSALDDGSPGTLREVVAAAPDGATITFASNLSGETIRLLQGEIALTRAVTLDGDIDGDGLFDVTVSGETDSRLFRVDAPGSAVVFEGLALLDGFDVLGGSAIFSERAEELSIIGWLFENNEAHSRGGAVAIEGGTVVSSLLECTFFENESGGEGGAIFARRGIKARRCFFHNNRVLGGGLGGALSIDAFLDEVTRIDQCDFAFNWANGGKGGSIYATTPMIVKGTLFSRSTSTSGALEGGAIHLMSEASETRFENCAFHDNRIDPQGDVQIASGGAIHIGGPAPVHIVQCSFSGNGSPSVDSAGGAIATSNPATTIDIRHSTFENNFTGSPGLTIWNPFNANILLQHSIVGDDFGLTDHIVGAYQSTGFNMFTDPSQPGAHGTDILGGVLDLIQTTSPAVNLPPFPIDSSNIGPFFLSGPLPSSLPGPQSSARDGGDPTLDSSSPGLSGRDARGFCRFLGSRIDIGALEGGSGGDAMGQLNLNHAGIGDTTLHLTGDALTSGGSADLWLTETPHDAPGFLILSAASSDAPLAEGTLVPAAPFTIVPLSPGTEEVYCMTGITGGFGPATVFAQAIYVDPTPGTIVALSNALSVELLP